MQDLETRFEGTHLVFETGDMKILRDGRLQMTILVPYDSCDAALLLRDSYGIMLEADVVPVTRVAP